jgi:16S rRNA (guanine966-N2)-methyltransferase
LRVIAGNYRGRILKGPPTLETRPTSDRLRETLFNVIASRVSGARFLDLCAGSGAVGIEALSRGADHTTFVDRSRKMRPLITANLDLCGASQDDFAVVTVDVVEFLRQSVKRNAEPWDIVFFDPPYDADYLGVLDAFGGFPVELLSADGLLIVEHFHKLELPIEIGKLTRQRLLKQGESALSFYQRKADDTP